MKPTLTNVILSSNYASDNIIVLMLSKSSGSALFDNALDNAQFAMSLRLASMRNENDVKEWYGKLQDTDFNGIQFHEFSVSELTGGEHTGIITKGGNVARVIRRANNLTRNDTMQQLKAQFTNASGNIKFE